MILNFYPHLALILADFAPLIWRNNYLWLSKYIFCLPTHTVNPFMRLQRFKCKIGLKIDDFVFLTDNVALILARFASSMVHNT